MAALTIVCILAKVRFPPSRSSCGGHQLDRLPQLLPLQTRLHYDAPMLSPCADRPHPPQHVHSCRLAFRYQHGSHAAVQSVPRPDQRWLPWLRLMLNFTIDGRCYRAHWHINEPAKASASLLFPRLLQTQFTIDVQFRGNEIHFSRCRRWAIPWPGVQAVSEPELFHLCTTSRT